MTTPKPAFNIIEEALSYAKICAGFPDKSKVPELMKKQLSLHTTQALAALKEIRESVPDMRIEPPRGLAEGADRFSRMQIAAKILHEANGGGV